MAARVVRAVAALVAGGLVCAACGSKSAARDADAGKHEDASDLDADGGDAGTIEPIADAMADVGIDVMQTPGFDSGNVSCTNSSGCPAGDVCCASVGGLIARSLCTPEKSCGSGAESCESGGEACAHGTCARYVCMVNGLGTIKTVVYACSPPMVANGACSLTPNLDAGRDAAASGGSP